MAFGTGPALATSGVPADSDRLLRDGCGGVWRTGRAARLGACPVLAFAPLRRSLSESSRLAGAAALGGFPPPSPPLDFLPPVGRQRRGIPTYGGVAMPCRCRPKGTPQPATWGPRPQTCGRGGSGRSAKADGETLDPRGAGRGAPGPTASRTGYLERTAMEPESSSGGAGRNGLRHTISDVTHLFVLGKDFAPLLSPRHTAVTDRTQGREPCVTRG